MRHKFIYNQYNRYNAMRWKWWLRFSWWNEISANKNMADIQKYSKKLWKLYRQVKHLASAHESLPAGNVSQFYRNCTKIMLSHGVSLLLFHWKALRIPNDILMSYVRMKGDWMWGNASKSLYVTAVDAAIKKVMSRLVQQVRGGMEVWVLDSYEDFSRNLTSKSLNSARALADQYHVMCLSFIT